jgi:hypothetical protein
MTRMVVMAFLLSWPLISTARSIQVRTNNESGAPFPNVLVIVRSLSGGMEQGRYLTDAKGETPQIQLHDDLNQVIATCPYGLCKTVVHEFFASSTPNQVVLQLPARSTDELGELFNAPEVELTFSPPHSAHQPAKPVNLFVRDPRAIREEWHRTSADGKVKIQLIDENMRVLVIDEDKIYRYVVAKDCASPLVKDPGFDCVQNKTGTVELKQPAQ